MNKIKRNLSRIRSRDAGGAMLTAGELAESIGPSPIIEVIKRLLK